VPLPEWCARAGKALGPEERAQIVREVRGAAYSVIERKGATSHAIGVATARIVRAIVRDEEAILPVSVPVEAGVCIGVPSVVGARGARPMGLPEMSAAERAAFDASVGAVRAASAALPA
jgi:L-lactate dehydrogenase